MLNTMTSTMVEKENMDHIRSENPAGDQTWMMADVEEEDDDDVFFTEEAFEMYSLSRLQNFKAQPTDGNRTITRPRRGRDQSEKAKEKTKNQPQNTDSATQPVAKQQEVNKQQATPKKKVKPKQKATPIYSLASPYPNLNYPTFSRLTIGQHKKFIALQTKYGSKGTRVTTSQESAELQHWRQLGAMIYQDQQDFNAFAEFAAKQNAEVYMNMPPAAVKFVNDALQANIQRVLTLPHQYAVLQTFTLNPGVPTPSDPKLQRIGSPVFIGKIPNLQIPGLDDHKVTLNRSPIEGEPTPVKTDNIANESNVHKLAELQNADIVLSHSSLLTLVNNHAPLYDQQWEIPFEVKVTQSATASHRVVYLRKPLLKHVYYPNEASALYHKYLLKKLLTADTKDKYCQVSTRTEEDDQCLVDISEECHLEQAARRGALQPEEENGDFGEASLFDLETFGSELPVAKPTEVTSSAADQESSTKLKEVGDIPNGKKHVGNEMSDETELKQQDKCLDSDSEILEPLVEGLSTNDQIEISMSQQHDHKNDQEANLRHDFSKEADVKEVNFNIDNRQMAPTDGDYQNGEDIESKEKQEYGRNETNIPQNVTPSLASAEQNSEKPVEFPEKRVSRVVRMNVRSLSKSLSDDDQTSDDVDDLLVVSEHTNTAMVTLRKLSPKTVRLRSSSESSDDDLKLTIVTDSEILSGPEREVAKRGRKKHKLTDSFTCVDTQHAKHANAQTGSAADNKMDVDDTTETETNLITAHQKRPNEEMNKTTNLEEYGNTMKPEEVSNKDNSSNEIKMELPPPSTPRAVTRRSSRIRQQSSSEDNKTGDEVDATPAKRPRGRRRGQKVVEQVQQGELQVQSMDGQVQNGSVQQVQGGVKLDRDKGESEEVDTDEKYSKDDLMKSTKRGRGRPRKVAVDSKGLQDSGNVNVDVSSEEKGQNEESTDGDIEDSEKLIGRRTRSSGIAAPASSLPARASTRSTRRNVIENRDIEIPLKETGQKTDSKDLTVDDTNEKNEKLSMPVKVEGDSNNVKEQASPSRNQHQERLVSNKTDLMNTKDRTCPTNIEENVGQADRKSSKSGKKNLKDKASPETPRKLGRSATRKANEPKSKSESTIDEIMRLQEKMLTRQKNGKSESTSQPSQISPNQQQKPHDGQVQTSEGSAKLNYEGMDLEDIPEGNYAYSLWKFGRLRLLVRSKSHGMLTEGQDVHTSTVASVVAKMETHSELGLGIQTLSDFTRAWLNLYMRPGSKVIRGRIDSRTSEILSWECLDHSWIDQSQLFFNPAMCMKMLYHIVIKLAGLSEGRYLLRHRPGDAHVCIYQCMEQAAKNVRATYDLHAAHQAAKLMTSLPPTMPWVPLDPNGPYRSKRWQGRAPLTFPPCPPNFKHPSTQHHGGHHHGGQFNKRKKKGRKQVNR